MSLPHWNRLQQLFSRPHSWTKEERDEAYYLYVYIPRFSVRRLTEWEVWEQGADVSNQTASDVVFDEGLNDWFRRTHFGELLLVSGPTDRTAPQTIFAVGCRACAVRQPHSQDYHFRRLRQAAARYESTRIEHDGTYITRFHLEPVRGEEE